MSPAELTAWATVAIAVFTGGVGVTTCLLVWYGIREMRKSSDERARDRNADRQRFEAAAEAERLRHEEVMAELNAQNRRLDAQLAGFDAQNRRLDAQLAGFDAQNRRLDAQARSLDAQTDALKALLLRLAPAAPAE